MAATHGAAFGTVLQALARERGVQPVRCYLRGEGKNPANAWPRELLLSAHRAFYYPASLYPSSSLTAAPVLLLTNLLP